MTEINVEKVFVLYFIQACNPDRVQQPFFAKYDPDATWLDQLQLTFGAEKFFFQDEYGMLCVENKQALVLIMMCFHRKTI